MDRLGYATPAALARALGVDRATPARWLAGTRAVPPVTARLIRATPDPARGTVAVFFS